MAAEFYDDCTRKNLPSFGHVVLLIPVLGMLRNVTPLFWPRVNFMSPIVHIFNIEFTRIKLHFLNCDLLFSKTGITCYR